MAQLEKKPNAQYLKQQNVIEKNTMKKCDLVSRQEDANDVLP